MATTIIETLNIIILSIFADISDLGSFIAKLASLSISLLILLKGKFIK